MTLRGQKGTMYEGGIRVPGVIEWPSHIQQARVTQFNSVTSDILPTLCDLAGQPVPNRPLDGISLIPAINGTMQSRPSPMFFWSFETRKVFSEESQSYINPALQEGTTPLAKIMDGKYTRTFRNLQYPAISKDHFGGARVMMDKQFKLVIDAQSSDQSSIELFDLTNDPTESHNLVAVEPDIAKSMQKQLHDWQQSVLESLTGKDYQ